MKLNIGINALQSISHSEISALVTSSNFSLWLLTNDDFNFPCEHFEVYETVLRPLLAMADECWVYRGTGNQIDSDIFAITSDILTPEKAKFSINIAGDPITGKEGFWNASGWKRGSIVITLPIAQFNQQKTEIFKACLGATVINNYHTAHNAAAVNYAHKKLSAKSHLVFCLSASNGLDYMDVFAPEPLVFQLFEDAIQACGFC